MTFTDAIKVGVDSFANFSGRSSRSEYWWFWLGCCLFEIIVPAICAAIGAAINGSRGMVAGALGGAAMSWILTVVPLLAVSVRRLHDTGHSGWWYFISLIPVIGPIWFIILMCTESDEANAYGLPSY